jgi:hypothetical protein
MKFQQPHLRVHGAKSSRTLFWEMRKDRMLPFRGFFLCKKSSSPGEEDFFNAKKGG